MLCGVALRRWLCKKWNINKHVLRMVATCAVLSNPPNIPRAANFVISVLTVSEAVPQTCDIPSSNIHCTYSQHRPYVTMWHQESINYSQQYCRMATGRLSHRWQPGCKANDARKCCHAWENVAVGTWSGNSYRPIFIYCHVRIRASMQMFLCISGSWRIGPFSFIAISIPCILSVLYGVITLKETFSVLPIQPTLTWHQDRASRSYRPLRHSSAFRRSCTRHRPSHSFRLKMTS